MERRTFLGLAAATLVVAGCGSDTGSGSTASGGGSGRLSLYTSSPKDQYDPAVAKFQTDTGVTVEVVSAGTGELIKRIQSEGANPLGDLQWGGLGAAVAAAMDNFDEYVTANDADILPAYRGSTHNKKLTAFSIMVNSLMLNKKLTDGITVTGWESLLAPELKGKIAFADPAKSSSALSQIVNMLHAMGNGNPENGWDYVGQFAKQLDGKLQGSSSTVYQNVASGEYALGITNETNAVKYVQSGADVSVVYPVEGNIVLADNVMLIKGAKNPDNAKKFIDYLTSLDYQSTMESVGLRTVRTDVTQEDFPALDTINVIEEDEDWMAANSSKIRDHFQDLFTA